MNSFSRSAMYQFSAFFSFTFRRKNRPLESPKNRRFFQNRPQAVTNLPKMEILTPKEVSKLLKKSVRWVYANGTDLGGVKIGGSWIFTQENFYDAIQRKKQVAGYHALK